MSSRDYVEQLHFRKLGLLLLAFCLIYLYFNINEYLTTGYKLEGSERLLIDRLFLGDYSLLFWGAQSICVFIPAAVMITVLGFKRYHGYNIPGVVLSSALVIVGAWAKRYIIVVPTLRSPYLPSGQGLPWEWTHYHPTWVEWSITAAAVAGFALIYTLMAKLFPIVSIWETRPQEQEVAEVETEAAPSRWWKPGVVFPILALAVLLLLSGISAHAAGPAKPKHPKPAAITPSGRLYQQRRRAANPLPMSRHPFLRGACSCIRAVSLVHNKVRRIQPKKTRRRCQP